MRTTRQHGESDSLTTLDANDTKLLTAKQERALLLELAHCKLKLSEALNRLPGFEPSEAGDSPQAVSQYIAEYYENLAHKGSEHARLGATYSRYKQIRWKLAMANMRLVAHVAKRFRERGLSYADLIQEGFCGLLEAIDRFEMSHNTKLATYATWWIRQAIQRAVAAGAYPVRLSPRHLRQLAQNQGDLDDSTPEAADDEPRSVSSEVIQRIHVATRPTVSLDAGFQNQSNFSLLHVMSDADSDHTDDFEMEETIAQLLASLRPREQEVLALRFGLGGKPRLSLSQVGKALLVSKERVRQIQDRALEKLRQAARDSSLADFLPALA